MQNFDPIWDKIYGEGWQLNRYPFSSIVSVICRNFATRDSNKPAPKILEIGCGAGNNLWFAAREGFSVTGLDASKPALNFAKSRFEMDSLEGKFDLGDFTELPYEDNYFDFAFERAALNQAPKPAAKLAVAEVARVLKKGSLFYSEIYSDRSTSRGILGKDGLLHDVQGPFSGVGQIGFYSKSEIMSLFSEHFNLHSLQHSETLDLLNGPIEVQAHWSVTAKVK